MTKSNNKITKGVITVAGLGTRFLPATKAMPKEMLPVVDKPVVQYIVEEMASSGITDIMFVTSANKRAIEDHFDRDSALEYFLEKKGKLDKIQDLINLRKKVRFFYTRQSSPKGNGHALLCAKEFCGDESFAFSDGDSIIDARTPVIKQLQKVFYKNNASVIGVQRIDDRQTMTKYGNVYGEKLKTQNSKLKILSDVYRVQKIVEKPKLKNVSPYGLIVGGMRYIFTPDIWQELESQGKGRDGEIWLADAANTLARKRPLFAYEYQGKYFDTGNPKALLETALHFAKKQGLL
jgi:UTP--glucose-1-phosphate uridylyltransferase